MLKLELHDMLIFMVFGRFFEFFFLCYFIVFLYFVEHRAFILNAM